MLGLRSWGRRGFSFISFSTVFVTFVHQVATERKQKEKRARREIWAPAFLLVTAVCP